MFELKNDSDTYQRAMKKIIHDMMHQNMEDYVDGTLAKTNKRNDHLDDLSLIMGPIWNNFSLGSILRNVPLVSLLVKF